MTAIPILTTERLTLRAPRLSDFEPYAAFFASERSVHEGGPLDRVQSWREFATAIAAWTLHGYGVWSIEDRETGAYLGETGLFHPDYYPEAELGWTLIPEAEGKGVAHEAALAARDWAYGVAGISTLVSYIAPANDRSIRLAERLGARRDPDAARPDDDPCLVYRHAPPEVRP
jgi:RimJ/RimL family protein N-acetyltransferase